MATVKIGFWNLRRLSGASSEEKDAYIKSTVKRLGVDIMMMCEVVGDDSGDDNEEESDGDTEMTDASPFSIVGQNLSYRKKNPWQLCYSCMDKDGKDVKLVRYEPTASDLYAKFAFKGGNNFSRLVDRGVAHYAMPVASGTLHVLGFHAPANDASATKAVSYVLSHLSENVRDLRGQKWLFLGDMNVEPADFNARTNRTFSNWMANSGSATYHGWTSDKEYDYGFTNVSGWEITNYRRTLRAANGDHNPVTIKVTV